MNTNEIELATKKLYSFIGTSLQLSIDQIRKCVVAISNLNDPEIEEKLKRLL